MARDADNSNYRPAKHRIKRNLPKSADFDPFVSALRVQVMASPIHADPVDALHVRLPTMIE
jgi:hypothetical protein